ncbi:hypothetical protein NDU88_000380 [Pleurodeles waltl]|uniref:Uncharacterized protein n=1 Tax=Pleurodeles waltl TaxID=8319 RepID=A0AAV7UT69_PLEWA|nr:hypothetical protein NDU88_000380 [Pleurodeles waltl]
MSQDEQVLRQAGRLDLLREEALALGRPGRRASAGVAAEVMACSPPRCGAASLKVRRGGKGAGGPSREGAPWEGHGWDGRRNREGRGPRASPGAGHPRATLQPLGLARKGRGSPIACALPQKREFHKVLRGPVGPRSWLEQGRGGRRRAKGCLH